MLMADGHSYVQASEISLCQEAEAGRVGLAPLSFGATHLAASCWNLKVWGAQMCKEGDLRLPHCP